MGLQTYPTNRDPDLNHSTRGRQLFERPLRGASHAYCHGRGALKCWYRSRERTYMLGKSIQCGNDSQASYSLLTFEDMCRSSLPTANSPRLPPYILWRMPQGMVLLPSFKVNYSAPVHLSILSRQCSWYKTGCQSQYFTGLVASGESERWENRARKGRREEEVQARRKRVTETKSSTNFRVIRGQAAN